MGSVIADALTLTPPDIDSPSRDDLVGHAADRPRHSQARQERSCTGCCAGGPWPLPIWSLNISRPNCCAAPSPPAVSSAHFLGPWSAGSALVLLIRAAGDAHPAGSAHFAAGGMGAITQAMAAAAKQAGAEIRTGAEVAEIRVKDGVRHGVVLSTGEEIPASAVISNADPKRTLAEAGRSHPSFARTSSKKLQHYRMTGTVAKVNLALVGLPNFTALKNGNAAALSTDASRSAPEIDYLERAFDESKYGNFSKQPYLEVTIPSLTDPSLAPAAST